MTAPKAYKSRHTESIFLVVLIKVEHGAGLSLLYDDKACQVGKVVE